MVKTKDALDAHQIYIPALAKLKEQYGQLGYQLEQTWRTD